MQTLLLQAIQEALEEQTIHGHPFKTDQNIRRSATIPHYSISGSCNGWWIYIMEYSNTIHIRGNERYYDIPIKHPQLIEEIINTIHQIAHLKPTPTANPDFLAISE